jgi:carotenoid 1,2-hydratase
LEPLERRFLGWDWSRAPLSDGGAALLYDPAMRDGKAQPLALAVDAKGQVGSFEAPPRAAMRRGFWGVARETRSEAGHRPRILNTLTDAPFYTRSLIETRLLGEDVVAMHESLSLTRFDNRLVQLMLPFRMPRRG